MYAIRGIFFHPGPMNFPNYTTISYKKTYEVIFIIRAAKMCCIAFVFYGETFVYHNCGQTVLCGGKSAFIRTSVDKLVSAVIYDLFPSHI